MVFWELFNSPSAMPFFGGFRSSSTKSRSKSATPISSSGLSNEAYRDSENELVAKPKANSFRRFFATQPRKKKPSWDEDQHRRTSVARSETFNKKQDGSIPRTAISPRDKAGRILNSGGEMCDFDSKTTDAGEFLKRRRGVCGVKSCSSLFLKHYSFYGATYTGARKVYFQSISSDTTHGISWFLPQLFLAVPS